MKNVVIAALFAATLVTPLAAQHGAPARPARIYTTSPVTTADAASWRSDLQQLVAELETHHPNPYHKAGRDRFKAAVAQLDERIPRLAAHEIIVEFERLFALVGDGHTNINLAWCRFPSAAHSPRHV